MGTLAAQADEADEAPDGHSAPDRHSGPASLLIRGARRNRETRSAVD
jgi:hypothetical protein